MGTQGVLKSKGGIVTELLRNAFVGANIIPTVLLLLMVLYWLIAMIGALDLDFFDLDLEAGDTTGPLYALAVFLNIGEVPFGIVSSLVILNFWTLAMLMYFLPFEAGSLVSGLLLIPAFVASILLTKVEITPLRGIFKNSKETKIQISEIMDQRCRLLCDVAEGRLGQAELRQKGKSFVVNVKAEFSTDAFKKNEIAYIFSRDKEKNVYYITKTIINKYGGEE